MTETQGNTGTALLAGGVVFFAVPLGIAGIFLSAQGMQGVAQVFMEAGVFGYGLFAAMFVVCLASAVGLFLAVRKGSPPALAILPVLVLPLIAVAGLTVSRSSVLNVMGMVSAADRTMVLAASIAETTNIETIAFAFIVAALLMIAVGATLTISRAGRASGIIAASGSLMLAVMSFVLAGYWGGIANGFRAMASGAPVDRSRILLALIDELSATHRLGLVLLEVFIVGAIGSTVVLLKIKRSHAVATGLALLMTGIGIAGAHARGKREIFAIPDFEVLFPRATRTLDGSSPIKAEEFEVESNAAEPIGERIAARLEGEGEVAGLLISDTSTAPSLRLALQAAHVHQATVQLLAAGKRAPPPANLDQRCDLCVVFEQSQRAVPVVVLWPNETCEGCVAFDPTWKPGEAPEPIDWPARGAKFDWRQGDLDVLLDAATVAWHNGYVLNVVVPAADGSDQGTDATDEE